MDAPAPDFSSVLRVLAEKLGMTPAEFAAATIVIEGGAVKVVPGDQPEVDVPVPVEAGSAGSKKASPDA